MEVGFDDAMACNELMLDLIGFECKRVLIMVTDVCRFSDLFHFELNYMLHELKQV